MKPAWSLFLLGGWALPLAAASEPGLSANPAGQLVYATDDRGNRVPDFSSCGGAGGDRPLPVAPVRVVVSPPPGEVSRVGTVNAGGSMRLPEAKVCWQSKE